MDKLPKTNISDYNQTLKFLRKFDEDEIKYIIYIDD